MQKLHFLIKINAPAKKVWETMLADQTYREWTATFNPGSYFEGSWEEGSRIKFLGPDQDGKLGGMYSLITDNRPYEYIAIEHQGVIINGVEDTSAEGQQWAGAMETYTFREVDGVTEVGIEIDVADEMVAEFKTAWPKALEKLKQLAEK